VQIAKLKGMHVIGSAGGGEKCAFVRDLGADAVIDYKAEGKLSRKLAEAAPDGIDVYFDNVGGEHLDAALGAARKDARFAICGMIAGYNSGVPAGFANIMNIIKQRIRIQGFIYSDWMADMPAFHAEMGAWLMAGKISQRQTVHDGLAAMPEAFLALFSGGNTGKMLVRL
jgi:NADPH-dependent curcumin reductase CurA